MIILAATVILVVITILTMFQIALVMGAPFGRFTLGGQHEGALPHKLRIASGVSIAVNGVIALLILRNLGVVDMNPRLSSVGLWVFAGYFVLNTIMNALSRSKYEQFVMTPLTAILAVCFFVLAIG